MFWVGNFYKVGLPKFEVGLSNIIRYRNIHHKAKLFHLCSPTRILGLLQTGAHLVVLKQTYQK